jgi:hypothetical protein
MGAFLGLFWYAVYQFASDYLLRPKNHVCSMLCVGRKYCPKSAGRNFRSAKYKSCVLGRRASCCADGSDEQCGRSGQLDSRPNMRVTCSEDGQACQMPSLDARMSHRLERPFAAGRLFFRKPVREVSAGLKPLGGVLPIQNLLEQKSSRHFRPANCPACIHSTTDARILSFSD